MLMMNMMMTTVMNIVQANEVEHNNGEQRSLLAVAWEGTRRR